MNSAANQYSNQCSGGGLGNQGLDQMQAQSGGGASGLFSKGQNYMTAKDIREFCLNKARQAFVGPAAIKLAENLAVYFIKADTFEVAKDVITRGDGKTAPEIISTGEKARAFISGSQQ